MNDRGNCFSLLFVTVRPYVRLSRHVKRVNEGKKKRWAQHCTEGVVAFNEQLHMVAVRYSPNNLS